MKFVPEKDIVIMSLVDLEHCGFCYDDYLGELFLHGIDDKAAESPVMLVVDFTGGAIVTKDTPSEVLADMAKSHKRFIDHLEKMGVSDD